MKRLIRLFFVVMLLLSSCSKSEAPSEKLTIITTLFPQYDIARTIAGDLADVKLILPPGVEAHSFEPTPRDTAAIEGADLFIYTSQVMEPWTERVSSDNQLEVAQDIEAAEAEAHADESAEEQAAHGEIDPHFWTSPHHALPMIETILQAMIAKDPDHQAVFEQNARALQTRFQALDLRYETELSALGHKEFLFAGHSVFGYVAKQYGITFITPYEGFSPDAEPSAKRIAELIDTLRQKNTKVIFHEELIDPKIARVIAEQTGAELVLLHGAHNVSKEEATAGLTYEAILTENLQKLLKAGQ